jgi:hypothetical protein
MPKAKSIDELLLSVEAAGEAWLVRGQKTYDYRSELRKGGGIWSKELAAWSFKTNPESLVVTLNGETRAEEEAKHRARQERGRQLSKAKAQMAEWRENKAAADAEWQRLWTDPVSKAEIDRVTAEMFAQRPDGYFWPLGLKSPFCSCGVHVLWRLYCNADKDIAKATSSYHMECPACFSDYTR